MSWLIAACVPALLMLVTFALQRLESAITVRDAVDEVAEMIERIVPSPRVLEPVRLPAAGLRFVDEPGLPTRICRLDTENPQFQRTRHANRV